MKALCVLICSCPGLIAAGHNALLPQPQAARYGEGRLPLKGLSVVLASPSTAEDQFTMRRLSEGLARRGGSSGARTIRLTRTGPVDALPGDNDQTGPESRESYHLRITPAGGEVRARSSA